jgi:hypothetical protein
MTKDPANFREYAGTLISVIVIAAYLSIGFVQMAIATFIGTSLTVPADWNTTMQSLANIALGYLIGKQTVGSSQSVNIPMGDAASSTTTVQTESK